MKTLPIEFIKLQFDFAQKVCEILKISFNQALFEYTCMPMRLGVAKSMQAEDPKWTAFIEYMENSKDYKKAYAYYQKIGGDLKPMRKQYGCFSFDYIADEKIVKIHFTNNDNPIPGVLSDERIEQRLSELREMFIDIKNNYPDTIEVVSSSWLYNVEAFKRLFPNEFFMHQTVKVDYRSLGLWGQFINKFGAVKIEVLENFLRNISKAQNIDDINKSFPLQDLKSYADIKYFYRFLKI